MRINKNNGTVTTVGQLEDTGGHNFDNMEGLAFSFSAPHVLYGANNPGEGLSQLVTIDRLTGLVTPIGSGIGFVNVECLVFAPDGTLYGFSNGNSLQDRFITIDPTPGGDLFRRQRAVYDIEGCVFWKLTPVVSKSIVRGQDAVQTPDGAIRIWREIQQLDPERDDQRICICVVYESVGLRFGARIALYAPTASYHLNSSTAPRVHSIPIDARRTAIRSRRCEWLRTGRGKEALIRAMNNVGEILSRVCEPTCWRRRTPWSARISAL